MMLGGSPKGVSISVSVQVKLVGSPSRAGGFPDLAKYERIYEINPHTPADPKFDYSCLAKYGQMLYD